MNGSVGLPNTRFISSGLMEEGSTAGKWVSHCLFQTDIKPCIFKVKTITIVEA